jgi:hypothetical protein
MHGEWASTLRREPVTRRVGRGIIATKLICEERRYKISTRAPTRPSGSNRTRPQIQNQTGRALLMLSNRRRTTLEKTRSVKVARTSKTGSKLMHTRLHPTSLSTDPSFLSRPLGSPATISTRTTLSQQTRETPNIAETVSRNLHPHSEWSTLSIHSSSMLTITIMREAKSPVVSSSKTTSKTNRPTQGIRVTQITTFQTRTSRDWPSQLTISMTRRA